MGLIVDPRGEPFEDEQVEADPEEERTLGRDELERMLREMVARNKDVTRPTRAQRLLDHVERACLEEDEIELGCAVALLHAGRVANQQGLFLQVLLQLAYEIKSETELLTQQCRVCGCTNERACPGGCHWVEFDLCSQCAEKGGE